jgi:hypothetical protein
MAKKVIQFHVDPEDFKNEILSGVAMQFKNFSKNFKPKEPTIWCGRKEAKEILGITYPTLLDWGKKGLVHPFKVGSRVRYRRKDIEQVLLSSNKKAPE